MEQHRERERAEEEEGHKAAAATAAAAAVTCCCSWSFSLKKPSSSLPLAARNQVERDAAGFTLLRTTY